VSPIAAGSMSPGIQEKIEICHYEQVEMKN